MKKGMKSAFAATLALTACFGGISTYAAHDENLNVYTLDTVVVEADKTKNKFGDTITE
jgi:spermidine/putrescine-binding protein